MTEEKLTDLIDDEDCDADIVEFTDESGKILHFYHIETIEYQKRFFAFFTPAEEIEGIENDEIIIYEVTGEDGNEELVPVLDDDLLDAVFQEFCNIMDECEDEDCDYCRHHKE